MYTYQPFGKFSFGNFVNAVLRLFVTLFLISIYSSVFAQGRNSVSNAPGDNVQFTVVVYDAATDFPLELARVMLRHGKTLVAGKVTNVGGRAIFQDVVPGWYNIVVRSVGYSEFYDSIRIDKSHAFDSVTLHEVKQEEVVVLGSHEANISTIDVKTGNQVFEAETYHAPPAGRITGLIQQNLAGASRAPTGEVHIRGQHGEYTYYVDGIPVPLGVFGGLNEVVDPKVIDRATFLTGGFPAEYGGQMAAVIDLNNRVPSGRFHVDFSTYAGSYFVPNGSSPFTPGTSVPFGASSSAPGDTLGSRVGPFRALNSNGQSLSLSDHLGRFGYFLSGSRQETDRRIDQPSPALYHDHGFDYFVYGKLDYILSEADYLTMNLNYGNTHTQIPFDALSISDDIQETSNAFQTLSYFHTISTEADAEKNIFVGGYVREGGLIFTPGLTDAPAFVFPSGDSAHPYNLMEDRKFTTAGIRTKYDARLSHEVQYAVGLTFSNTTGSEHFTSTDSVGKAGPEVLTNFVGSDFGVFAQTELHPLEWMRFDLGIRYDQHIAPDLPLQEHWSPRVKWTFLIDPFTSAYLYYGKVFMPTNIEGLRSITAGNSTSATGTAAEKDDIYEASITHTFDFGLTSKLAYFRKESAPGLDDQTVGSSAIKTPVNIAQVHAAGLEVALTYSNPVTPFSGYLNASIIHAYGSGPITGGFLRVSDAGIATDLDHDQRLSIVASLNYQPSDWFANIIGTYGSGLTNGNPSGLPYSTGLFDFNQFAHTTPSWIFNIGGGYTIHLKGSVSVEPSLYVTNIFNHLHLLKGAFFSGASWEEPRNVTLKLAMHL